MRPIERRGPAPPGPDAAFLDPERHADALLTAFRAALLADDPDRAFALIDRHCRLVAPEARHLLLRAEASRRAGFLDDAQADLANALADDPGDPAVLRFALRFGAPDLRRRAATLTLATPAAGRGLIVDAVETLLADGENFVVQLETYGENAVGFAAWTGPDDILTDVDAAQADAPMTDDPVTGDPKHWLAGPGRSAADLRLPLGRITFFRDGAAIGGRDFAPPPRFDDPNFPPADLTVIVPVFEDFSATVACFEALFCGGAPQGARIVAVDDASPNADLRQWLGARAAEGRIVLLRNPVNLGFAVSVNRALLCCRDGDVILLNADTLTPPGALERLTDIARRHSAGTATPLSNNGEYLSFPAPFRVNPLPTPQEIARIDALAALANGATAVDLPNGIGFCLYVSRACLDAVGPLPERYERGYYEDVEFCLRARAQNFRVIGVPGVFVGHAGSLSFRDDKRRLVRRNLSLLQRRFPDYRAESAAFIAADPLASARGAIEAFSPPARPTLLLVAATPLARFLARQRAEALAGGQPAPLLCLIERGKVLLRGAGDAQPQSLAFSLADAADLASFLSAASLAGVEIFDPLALARPMIALLRRLGAPLIAVAGALDWATPLRPPFEDFCLAPDAPGPCFRCAVTAFADPGADAPRRRDLRRKRALLAGAVLAPVDALSEKVTRRIFPRAKLLPIPDAPKSAAAPPADAPPETGALALYAPLADAAAEKFAAALAHAFGPQAAPRIILFGAAFAPLELMKNGALFVAGAIDDDEWPRLLRQYRISALASPFRGALFGPIDALSRRFGLPMAFFDYSFGAASLDAKHLALDPRLCDAKAAARVKAWFHSQPNRQAVR